MSPLHCCSLRWLRSSIPNGKVQLNWIVAYLHDVQKVLQGVRVVRVVRHDLRVCVRYLCAADIKTSDQAEARAAREPLCASVLVV